MCVFLEHIFLSLVFSISHIRPFQWLYLKMATWQLMSCITIWYIMPLLPLSLIDHFELICSLNHWTQYVSKFVRQLCNYKGYNVVNGLCWSQYFISCSVLSFNRTQDQSLVSGFRSVLKVFPLGQWWKLLIMLFILTITLRNTTLMWGRCHQKLKCSANLLDSHSM